MKSVKHFLAVNVLMLFLASLISTNAEGLEQGNVFFTADYLYWKASVDNLEYAITGIAFPSSAGETKDLDWKWNSGFKAGVGYSFCESSWDIYLNTTWYQSRVRASTTPSEGELLFATFANPFLLDLSFASSRFKINYHTLDFELRNTFCISPSLQIRPSFGLRAAWARDRNHLFYVAPATTEDIHLRERFHGIGPRIGLNVAWTFCNDWSLFCEGNYALLWGTTRTRFSSEAFDLVAADTRQHIRGLRHLTDLRIGLNWDHYFCSSRLAIQLALEHRLWLRYNQYQKFVGEVFTITNVNNSTDLSLYGLTLSANYYF